MGDEQGRWSETGEGLTGERRDGLVSSGACPVRKNIKLGFVLVRLYDGYPL